MIEVAEHKKQSKENQLLEIEQRFMSKRKKIDKRKDAEEKQRNKC